jgi:hypothetical protein
MQGHFCDYTLSTSDAWFDAIARVVQSQLVKEKAEVVAQRDEYKNRLINLVDTTLKDQEGRQKELSDSKALVKKLQAQLTEAV